VTEFDARMAELRERFVTRMVAERVEIEAELARGGWGAVRDVCHGLSGLAGVFGLAPIGDAARAVEDAVNDGASAEAIRALGAVLLARMKDADQGR
jgi:HPt (histidine-containing phosphotransfer) domain-containing protein